MTMIKFWGDWFYHTDVPESPLALPLGDAYGIYHVHHLDLRGKFLLSPRVRMPGLFIIVTVQPLVLVFGVYFAILFKYPAVSIGVVGWLVRGAMNLARALQYAV